MQVIKRDGRVVEFNPERIVKAITLAMSQTPGGVDIDLANKIASSVQKQFEDKTQATVYEIQDAVEKKLMASSRKEVAQSYITYRYNRDVARKSKTKEIFLDIIGAKANDIGIGSWCEYSWGRVAAVPAFHSSSTPDGIYGGSPCGYIFEIEGKTLYHAGDTGLNSEMKVIGEIYQPDIAMLPIGGKYTMDIEHAVKAAEWLEASEIIPMHYNTFDAIEVDIAEFERQIREIGKLPRIMNIEQ